MTLKDGAKKRAKNKEQEVLTHLRLTLDEKLFLWDAYLLDTNKKVHLGKILSIQFKSMRQVSNAYMLMGQIDYDLVVQELEYSVSEQILIIE